MRIKLAWMLGLLAAANGVVMLAVPTTWYAIVLGVANSGPLMLPHAPSLEASGRFSRLL